MSNRTKVTTKYQTSIPKNVRKFLDVSPGEEVEWNIVKSMVIVDTKKKIVNPVKFLTSQMKANINAVKIVHEARDELR